jgi:hypothetical protein
MFELTSPGRGVSWASSAALGLAELAARLGGKLRLTLVSWDGRVVSTGWLSGARIVREVRRLLSSVEWPPTRGVGCSASRLSKLRRTRGRMLTVLFSDLCLSSEPDAYLEGLEGSVVVIPPLAGAWQAALGYLLGRASERLRGRVTVVSWEELPRILRSIAGRMIAV